MYAIVDIETTGGSSSRHRITEIAVFRVDESEIQCIFHSLINPQQNIPLTITQLTGINDKMVQNAPTFPEIADQLNNVLTNHVFVAHNVNFDYRFLKAEFQRAGMTFNRKKLCTVRLSRKLFRGLTSYSLGKLCNSLNIKIKDRHRALGDAEATSILFQKMLLKNSELIQQFLNPQSLEALLPPHLNKGDFLALPEKQGLYYFKDAKKKIIYIGKAKNIKKRVHSHLSGTSNTGTKNYFLKSIYSLDYRTVNNELLLDLMEATEIKKHWPRYNRSMKRITLNYGLLNYTDRNGYERFSIIRCGKYDRPLIVFKSHDDIYSFLRNLVFDHQLCPRLSGLQPISSGPCNYIEEYECLGACSQKESPKSYNKRVRHAIKKDITVDSTFLIKEEIAEEKKAAVVLIEKGRYKGFGKVSLGFPYKDINQIKSTITPAYDDQDMSILIHAYLSKTKPENIHFYNS